LASGPPHQVAANRRTVPRTHTAAWTAIAATVAHSPDNAEASGCPATTATAVAVPFVSLTAGCLVISELLRRLHGGQGLELASLSMLSMDDIETVPVQAPTYAFGHVPVSPVPHITPAETPRAHLAG
jgi:hypothetical protein